MSTDERDPVQVRMDDLREQAREWFEADVREFRRSWVQNGPYRAETPAAGTDQARTDDLAQIRIGGLRNGR